MTESEAERIYWAFEALASAVGKCKLHKKNREAVDKKISEFRKKFSQTKSKIVNRKGKSKICQTELQLF